MSLADLRRLIALYFNLFLSPYLPTQFSGAPCFFIPAHPIILRTPVQTGISIHNPSFKTYNFFEDI